MSSSRIWKKRERENERRSSVLFAKGIGVRRSRRIRPRQLRMAFPIRRRSPHPRLDLLQSPLLQRPLPFRTLSVSLSLSLSLSFIPLSNSPFQLGFLNFVYITGVSNFCKKESSWRYWFLFLLWFYLLNVYSKYWIWIFWVNYRERTWTLLLIAFLPFLLDETTRKHFLALKKDWKILGILHLSLWSINNVWNLHYTGCSICISLRFSFN